MKILKAQCCLFKVSAFLEFSPHFKLTQTMLKKQEIAMHVEFLAQPAA
jgi:hypothetical protein